MDFPLTFVPFCFPLKVPTKRQQGDWSERPEWKICLTFYLPEKAVASEACGGILISTIVITFSWALCQGCLGYQNITNMTAVTQTVNLLSLPHMRRPGGAASGRRPVRLRLRGNGRFCDSLWSCLESGDQDRGQAGLSLRPTPSPGLLWPERPSHTLSLSPSLSLSLSSWAAKTGNRGEGREGWEMATIY